MTNWLKRIVLCSTLLVSYHANAILIGGVEFPQGNISFADAVVFYGDPSVCNFVTTAVDPETCLPDDVGSPYDNPADALGLPDWVFTGDSLTSLGSTSLGDGGQLVVRFLDNALTTSGNTDDDLYIFEIGSAIELFSVEISIDGINWISLGDNIGQPAGIDIDSIAGVVQGALYTWVRLSDNGTTGNNQTNSPFGEADIDAIGAISTVFVPPTSVSEPSMLVLLLSGFGLLAMRKFKSVK